MTPMELVHQAIMHRGEVPTASGAGWVCRCPGHDDHNPSLSIGEAKDGRALLHCHAGCTTEHVCAELGISMSQLYPRPASKATSKRSLSPRPRLGQKAIPNAGGESGRRVFASARESLAALEHARGPAISTWVYQNAQGEEVGWVARWDTAVGKRILPVSRVKSGWQHAGMPSPRPLYRLPELLSLPKPSRVFVVEGEKAAEAARLLGLVATTSPHGSRSAKKADWSPLAGQNVVILPDADEAGALYAVEVTRLALKAGAVSVRTAKLDQLWAELPEGGDIADLIDHAGSSPALRERIEALADQTEPHPAATTYTCAAEGSPVLVRMSEVSPEEVSWLWQGRFALGKLTLLAGDPGLGKSFLTLDMASRVSTGKAWPDAPESKQTAGSIVILSAEDDLADTIRPRLDAAGADVSRIVAIRAVRSASELAREAVRAFDLSRDLPALEQAIQTTQDCRLLIIDPITAYLGGVDSHKNADIRALLAPLAELAARYRVAVVLVTHFNKGATSAAIYRAMGSLAFAAAARAAWAVIKDPGDPGRRLLLPIKNNNAPDTGGLAYRIAALEQGRAPVLEWDSDPVHMTADEFLADQNGACLERADVGGTADWLRSLLANGPLSASSVERAAKDAGISMATVRRAKPKIGAQSRKVGFGDSWEWFIPAPAEGAQDTQSRAQGAHPPNTERLGPKPEENQVERSKTLSIADMSALGKPLAGDQSAPSLVDVELARSA